MNLFQRLIEYEIGHDRVESISNSRELSRRADVNEKRLGYKLRSYDATLDIISRYILTGFEVLTIQRIAVSEQLDDKTAGIIMVIGLYEASKLLSCYVINQSQKKISKEFNLKE